MVIFDAIHLDISIWYNAIYRIPGSLSIFWGLLQCSFWQSSSFLVDFWWARPWWSSSKMKVARSAGVAIYKKHQKTMALSEAAALGNFIVGWHIVLQISLISWTLKVAFFSFQSLCGLSLVPKRVWLFIFQRCFHFSHSTACVACHIPKPMWLLRFLKLCSKPVRLFTFQSMCGLSHSKAYVAFNIWKLFSKPVWLFTFSSLCGFSHSKACVACVAFHIPKPVLVSVVTSLFRPWPVAFGLEWNCSQGKDLETRRWVWESYGLPDNG